MESAGKSIEGPRSRPPQHPARDPPGQRVKSRRPVRIRIRRRGSSGRVESRGAAATSSTLAENAPTKPPGSRPFVKTMLWLLLLALILSLILW